MYVILLTNVLDLWDGSRVQDRTSQDGRLFASERQCTRCARAFLQSVSASTDVRCSSALSGTVGVAIDYGARDALMGYWTIRGGRETSLDKQNKRGDILRR